MAGEDNLKPVSSKEEARERGKKGGIASAKARKEKRILTDALKELLQDGGTVRKINMALLDQAVQGNTKAYEIIRDTIGEKPVEKTEDVTPKDIVVQSEKDKEALDDLKA